MRRMAAPKSGSAPGASASPISFSARRASAARRAARITLFEGTQPRDEAVAAEEVALDERHLAPSPAPIAAETRPAVPAPITTRL